MSDSNGHNMLFQDVEHELAHNIPFGDLDYLNQCTISRYLHRLEMLTEHLPSAKQMVDGAAKANQPSRLAIIGDPVVRNSINNALAYFHVSEQRQPLDGSIPTILELAGELLRNDSTLPPLQIGRSPAVRLGPHPHHGWIWSNEGMEDESTLRFRTIVDRHLAHDGLKLIAPSPEAVENLQKGAALLNDLLPQLSNSAIGHSHCIAMVAHRGAFISVTNPCIPGAIFLSESAATTPWVAADNLLHESLHAKFLDIEHTHAIMMPAYKPMHCLVRPPWRRPLSSASYLWPLTRLFTVVHVYVALAVFFSVIEQKSAGLTAKYGPTGEPNFGRRVRQSLDRAGYLVHQLLLNQHYLGPAGIVFSKWLLELINRLDPAPRPNGSYLHLIADLYQQEASLLAPSIARLSNDQIHSRVDSRLAGFQNNSLADILQEMLQSEIASVKRVAEQAGHNLPWTTTVSQTLATRQDHSPETLASSIWAIRALLCQSLLQIQPTRFTCESEAVTLEDMLLNSSRHVEAALHVVRSR